MLEGVKFYNPAEGGGRPQSPTFVSETENATNTKVNCGEDERV